MLAALLLASVAHAKLSQVEFREFIARSEIIVVATVQAVQTDGPSSPGWATFGAVETLKGKAPQTIEIAWTGEVHDQRVRGPGRYVLFLKRSSSHTLEAAVYGRSYWPLELNPETDGSCGDFVEHTRPLTTIDGVDTVLTSTLGQGSDARKVVCLDWLRAFLETEGSAQPTP